MTNSREIAEQAFALLRNALEESELQRLDLEERLQEPHPPEADIDQAYSALLREIEAVRADRDLWKKTSSQLQDVVSNERAKGKRLTKKLGVVESGADRNARREVNYWREQAEGFEEARQKFQQRIYELKKELTARDEQLDSQEASRVSAQELERANALLSERDGRISELSATLEANRLQSQDLERRLVELDSEVRSLSQQVIDAEAARNDACRATDLIDAELKDLRAHSSTNEHAVETLQQELDQQRKQNTEYQVRIGDLENQHDSEIAALRDEQAKEISSLRDEQAKEISSLRDGQTNEIDSLRDEQTREIGAIRDEHAGELNTLRETHAAELARSHEERSAESDELERLSQERADLEQRLQTELQKHAEQIEHRDAEQRAREQMHASALTKERADAAEAIRSEFEPRVEALTAQLNEQSNKLAETQAEVADERNRSDNLNEIANERRETLTRTTEKLEEMEERYEDAKWHLGKARHFEKLMHRRKKLVRNLISTIRAKQKSNNTLKAGLDSLRRYKANADERQQELLRRVEILEHSLNEAREKLAQANETRRSAAPQESAQQPSVEKAQSNQPGHTDTQQLHNQVTAQAEVIENLEADLKSARIAETEARTKLMDLEKLHNDIETKNTFIGTLQKDIEEQQKTAARLRKRDIEVKELRALVDEHTRRLKALQSENNQLRNAKDGEVDLIDQKKAAEQEKIIGKLTAKLKEYEASIATLSEAADSWKRKYDFLAAETPYGYESASSK